MCGFCYFKALNQNAENELTHTSYELMLACSHHELSAKQKHRRYELNRLPFLHAPLGAVHGEANSRAPHNSRRKPIH